MQDTPSARNYKVNPVLQHHDMKIFRKAYVISWPFLILALGLGQVVSDTLPLGNGHWIGSWNGTRISPDMAVMTNIPAPARNYVQQSIKIVWSFCYLLNSNTNLTSISPCSLCPCKSWQNFLLSSLSSDSNSSNFSQSISLTANPCL